MKMEPVLYQWHFDPAVLLLCIALACGFYALAGFKHVKNSVCFCTAILLFILATSSPLHYLGMHCYFSAHMVAHVIVLLLCGPLVVISLPSKSSSSLSTGMQSLSRFLYNYPWLGWLSGAGIMWAWHIPAVFDASFAHMHSPFSIMSMAHSGSMLLAGVLFSWPLFGPFKQYHIHPLAGILYLFTACISCSLLGLLITFAPPGTYHHYLELNNSMAMTEMNPFGISQVTDQQAAGLIMWVPCCIVYLGGCIYLLQQWFSETSTPGNELVKLSSSNNSND